MLKKLLLMALIVSFCVLPGLAAANDETLTGYCATCHGTGGWGPGETIPYLAGQSEQYLNAALKDIKERQRQTTLMWVISHGYEYEELEQMAAWFSGREWKNSENEVDADLAAQGQALSAACLSCHGPSAQGGGIIPHIAGLPVDYLYYAMLEYRDQVRNINGNARMMNMFAGMDEPSIKNFAHYFSSMH